MPRLDGCPFGRHGTKGSLCFRKIACAIDSGPHTQRVLCWASEFAAEVGASLLVIHVTKPAGNSQLELVNRARGEIKELLSDMGIKAEIAVGSGSVSRVVYDLALGFAADILVIGRHALTGRLHSDTYAMIRQSHCPVVSV